MNEQELDKQFRDLFMGERLPAESVQRILEQGRNENKTIWWRYWAPVAAAAAFVMLFSFQMAKEHDQEGFHFDVAGKIAMRHNSSTNRNFEVETASYDGVQRGLKDLAFSVTPLVKEKLLSAYEVIGARYCQLEGQQAAHLKVRNRKTGTLCTLYVASLNGPLSALKSADAHIDLEANHVDLWEDSGRLFALVD
ncbi:MAG: hypothetical protein CBD18_04935 [Opitutales bacterium TMED158]|nr:MAG: hypothetical protein CBD18_04935 [Opitutales bacterium TMED158]